MTTGKKNPADSLKILILDDEKQYRDTIRELLTRKGHFVTSVAYPSEALDLVGNQDFDILLLDLSMPEMDGIEVLKKVRKMNDEIEVIIITGHAELKFSIDAIRAGACDFITKPFHAIDIEQAIERTKKFAALNAKLKVAVKGLAALQEELKRLVGVEIIGESNAIREVVMLMSKVAASDDTSVLIIGESGTGKELVARGIHGMGKRKKEYFHSVNCAAVPESLFESEFFGYHKGAFTGANETIPGWFEVSNNGTLFLDEVSGMPLGLQGKLLRVLDQRTITKLGSHKEIMLNIRVIAATNKDLTQMVINDTFREDLYHRLSSFSIKIPALRERKEDIPLLAHHFLAFFNSKMGKKISKIDLAVMNALTDYSFPGNVRELKNMIERAVILCPGNRITRKEMLIPETAGAAHQLSNNTTDFNLERLEKKAIKAALALKGNNKSAAARLLGITRQSLERKLEKIK